MMSRNHLIAILFIAVLLLFCNAGFCQATFDPIQPQKKIVPFRIISQLNIDGRLDESAWDSARGVDDFIEILPNQGNPPSHRTVVKMLYNENYLYVGGICLDDEGKRTVRVPDFRRDFHPPSHDIFGFVIDGFKDTRNAMMFLTNPYGVQRDVLAFDDRSFDVEWDGLWKVRTQRTDSGWIAEISVPWKTLRYSPTEVDFQTWGINFCRQRRSTNQFYAWSPFPRAYSWARMSYEGLLDSLRIPPSGTNIRIQPYSLMSYGKTGKGDDWNKSFKMGGEVKWAIKPDKVLDLTFHTDFAQADADQLVNNTQRFSVFFPERRQFFLENAGLFNTGLNLNPDGNKNTPMTIQPFFSRRIGLDDDGNPITIQAGARYVQRGDLQNIGLLAIRQEASDSTSAASFFTGRYTHRIGKKSQVGALITSRMQEDAPGKPVQGYINWSGSVDGFVRINEKIQWNGMVSGTTNTGKKQDGMAAYSQLFYKDDWITAWWNQSIVSRDYNPEAGFVNRSNVICTSPGFYIVERGKWLPKFVRSFGPGFITNLIQTATTGKVEELTISAWPLWFNFHSGGYAGIQWSYQHQWLRETFEPLNATIAPGTYRYHRFIGYFGTDASKKLNMETNYSKGNFYNGKMRTTKVIVRYSPLPHVAFSNSVEQFRLRDVGINKLNATYYLYSMQTRLAINPRIQASFLYQCNTTNGSDGFNARFSWEYKPLSYLYLVFNSRNNNDDRSVVGIVKLSYLKQF
jgi:hypothetical protein